jgi:hypothetical protein
MRTPGDGPCPDGQDIVRQSRPGQAQPLAALAENTDHVLSVGTLGPLRIRPTGILNHVIEEESASERPRAKAHQLGVLAEPRAPRRVLSPAERQAALDSARGLGQVVDQILEDGR